METAQKEEKVSHGWDPPKVILVFCFLQGLIFLVEWFWFLMELAAKQR